MKSFCCFQLVLMGVFSLLAGCGESSSSPDSGPWDTGSDADTDTDGDGDTDTDGDGDTDTDGDGDTDTDGDGDTDTDSDTDTFTDSDSETVLSTDTIDGGPSTDEDAGTTDDSDSDSETETVTDSETAVDAGEPYECEAPEDPCVGGDGGVLPMCRLGCNGLEGVACDEAGMECVELTPLTCDGNETDDPPIGLCMPSDRLACESDADCCYPTDAVDVGRIGWCSGDINWRCRDSRCELRCEC